jgi:hypothetical protein
MTQYDPYSAAPALPFAIAPQRRPLATIQGKFPLTVLTLAQSPDSVAQPSGPCAAWLVRLPGLRQ